MSTGAVIAIIIIATAASGVLMMQFRRRWLAKINIAFTNRITGPFAGWLPGFGKSDNATVRIITTRRP
jgi:hypothetical protein